MEKINNLLDCLELLYYSDLKRQKCFFDLFHKTPGKIFLVFIILLKVLNVYYMYYPKSIQVTFIMEKNKC